MHLRPRQILSPRHSFPAPLFDCKTDVGAAVTVKHSLSSKLTDIPSGAVNSVKRGFVLLSQMPNGARIDFTDRVIDYLLAGRQMNDIEDIAGELPFDASQARDVTNAVSIVVGLLSDSDESVESFLDIAQNKIYDSDYRDTARQLAQLVVSKRQQLKRSLDLFSLAAQTLPSLRTCSITVDLRPRFESGRIVDAVSVALLHIDTDVQPEIYMQLTKSDISYLQKKLSQALSEMQTAEKLYAPRGE